MALPIQSIGDAFSTYRRARLDLVEHPKVRPFNIPKRLRYHLKQKPPGTENRELILVAALGGYTTLSAINTLPKQLLMLRTFAELVNYPLVLRYRLTAKHEESGASYLRFEIICTLEQALSQADSAGEVLGDLREGLAQLVGVTFDSGYSMSYTTEREDNAYAIQDLFDLGMTLVEIRRLAADDGVPLPFDGDADWAAIADLLRAVDIDAMLEIRCVATSNRQPIITSPSTSSDFLGVGLVSAPGLATRLFEAKTIAEMLSTTEVDSRRLGLQILLGSRKPLPIAVICAIGAEIAGKGSFDIDENPQPLMPGAEIPPVYRFTPAQALRIFRPAFAEMHWTSGASPLPPLSLPTAETEFPPGIELGQARARHVRSDQPVTVRIGLDERLEHMYIIGKTGSGKTNLLKYMVEQDITEGRSVTIIDPHGDLAKYARDVAPVERIRNNEVIYADLSDRDWIPVLNPLSEAKSNPAIRDRVIQDVVALLKSRVFHEYTGPRFEDLCRLGLQTLLDEGYPIEPSLVELPQLFLNKNFQEQVRKRLKNPDLQQRWKFEDELRSTRDYADVVHWLISKFTEIYSDTSVRAVVGGSRATIDIEDIVRRGSVLIVSIPESTLGRQAADFLGSLIVLQLKAALLKQGRDAYGHPERYHFVYIDEFQNFATTDFYRLVAEARKFGMGFVFAHQNLQQLRDFSPHTGQFEQRLIHALLGNVANTVIFSIGALDAELLSEHMGLTAKQSVDILLNIPRFKALTRTKVNKYRETQAFLLDTEQVKDVQGDGNKIAFEKQMKDSGIWRGRKEVLSEIGSRIAKVVSPAAV